MHDPRTWTLEDHATFVIKINTMGSELGRGESVRVVELDPVVALLSRIVLEGPLLKTDTVAATMRLLESLRSR